MSEVSARLRAIAAGLVIWVCGSAQAGLGVTELAPRGDDGPVTVFYTTAAAEAPFALGGGRLVLQVARDATPQPANGPGAGRLVMISHGSGGSPWVHADLARVLVAAGYTVAVPQHRRDNYLDDREPGPASWDLRPAEVSRAIDAVASDPRFGPALRLDRVGVYGMSAGGHTALTLAGGQWSPALFNQHCQANLAQDFNACVGLATGLTGGWADGIKQWVARRVLGTVFGGDTRPRGHVDPRIAAVVAAVPVAAHFDMQSLAQPRVPLALATAQGDIWLHPRFHSSRVLQACVGCAEIAAAPDAGHGAYLAPLPSGYTGLEARLLNDPPGFDRTAMAAIDLQIVAFFNRHVVHTKETGPVTKPD